MSVSKLHKKSYKKEIDMSVFSLFLIDFFVIRSKLNEFLVRCMLFVTGKLKNSIEITLVWLRAIAALQLALTNGIMIS